MILLAHSIFNIIFFLQYFWALLNEWYFCHMHIFVVDEFYLVTAMYIYFCYRMIQMMIIPLQLSKEMACKGCHGRISPEVVLVQ